MASHFNCLIMGAAGRDFHNFQTFFRARPEFRVRAFTAAQIPDIASRSFPRTLAGPDYDDDIPIYGEEELPRLIKDLEINFVFLCYSDLAHEDVMHKASIAQANGASFAMLGPNHTQLQSSKPVISVTAVRTGAGKSPLSQWIARHLSENGKTVGVMRHPMPYGDLSRQVLERFETLSDLDRHECTIEEREEYEPYIRMGQTIYAGVDYAQILQAAEEGSDVVLWDGGNNDFSFVRGDLNICVADALRAGHERLYYPGETNFLAANVIVIMKVSAAEEGETQKIRDFAQSANPKAAIVEADLDLAIEDPESIRGRRVLVVEDGPTLTHGGMSYGAGTIAARQHEAGELIDPRECAVGSIAAAFDEYPHLGNLLPALGYSEQQRKELSDTINRCAPEVIVDASPASLSVVPDITPPIVRVSYRFQQKAGPPLETLLDQFVSLSRDSQES